MRRLLIATALVAAIASQAFPGDRVRQAKLVSADAEYSVQVQFYRTIPGQPGIYSVHGPYPFVRERVESGVRTLYYASGGGTETALATMTTTDGWEIIGDPSGLWDVMTVVPEP
jgi:hypothetical protein